MPDGNLDFNCMLAQKIDNALLELGCYVIGREATSSQITITARKKPREQPAFLQPVPFKNWRE